MAIVIILLTLCAFALACLKHTRAKTANKKTQKIQVQLYCGNNTPFKRYVPYFVKTDIELLPAVAPSSSKSFEIVLCHSLGIEHALRTSAKFIVAMDPSKIDPHDKRVFYWLSRQHSWFRLHPDVIQAIRPANLWIYDMPDLNESHHPYKNAAIRNAIVKQICQLHRSIIS